MIFFHKTLFLFSSFIAGFSLMTLELVSSRIVAPIIGSSVYTWTSVIGVTILGLALGSLIGGYIADKFPKFSSLAIAFAISALLTWSVPVLADYSGLIVSPDTSILITALLLSVFLFLPPAIAIGSLSPIILKLYARNFSSIGKEYAVISSAWSFGSILGVFLTGFVFVSTIGSETTINLIASILLILASIFSIIEKTSLKVIGLTVILFGLGLVTVNKNLDENANIVYKKESAYYLAQVVDSKRPPARILYLDLDSHSIETKNHPNEFYTELYPIFEYLKEDLKKIHVIGAGAYTLPKNFALHYPEAEVSVTEIDPLVRGIGEKYFGLDIARIKTIESDARVYLSHTDEKFDLIFGDAYNSFISVPWHLMTQEFNETVKTRLENGGVYAINFIGALQGDSSAITESMIKTFSQTFPNYHVLAMGRTPTDIQNVILIGLNGELLLTEAGLKSKISAGKYGPVLVRYVVDKTTLNTENGLILSDNFAPVEHLMATVMKQYLPSYLSFLQGSLGD